MSDIVERLRNWRSVHLTQLRYVMESAADEIERLRLSIIGDYPGEDNPAREDNESVRKTGGDFGQPSPASAGSHAAVAWVVALGGDGLIIDGIFLRRTQAEKACAWRNEHTTYGARIIPLYEKPQTTLADEEREAVLEGMAIIANAGWNNDGLRCLLERLG
jgi:hypothetical protein